ncbi:MAG: tyrosine-type recombinase/integrase, partial [Moorellaceae bacterium]
RSDGRWTAQIVVGRDERGKPKRRYIYGKTRKEVQEQLTRLLAEQQQGLPIDPVKQTVKDFLVSWLEDSVKSSVRPTTYENYRNVVHTHIIPTLGDIPLAKLAPQHLQHLFRTMQDKGLTRSVKLAYTVLHKALGQAVKWGLIPRNIAELVDRPKIATKEMKVLTPEEIAKFLEAARDDRLYALYVVAIACGLRIGEIFALKWEDIDFETCRMQVRRQLQWINGEPRFVEPKSVKSRRSIVMPQVVVDALKEHRKRQEAERFAAGDAWQEWGLVFTTTVGTPLHRANVRTRSFVRILEKAGLPQVRLHDLRHSCATLLLTRGVHPKLVQEQLGHSQISITMDLYSHVLPALHREAALQMDAALAEQLKRRGRDLSDS